MAGLYLGLSHIGTVTVVLRKRGRNVDPNTTNILVAKAPELTSRQGGSRYQQWGRRAD